MNAKLYYHSIGSDKQAVARVFMFKGTGVFKINNDRNLESYFPRETFRMVVMQPLNVVNMENNFDFKITVSGGGNSGLRAPSR